VQLFSAFERCSPSSEFIKFERTQKTCKNQRKILARPYYEHNRTNCIDSTCYSAVNFGSKTA